VGHDPVWGLLLGMEHFHSPCDLALLEVGVAPYGNEDFVGRCGGQDDVVEAVGGLAARYEMELALDPEDHEAALHQLLHSLRDDWQEKLCG